MGCSSGAGNSTTRRACDRRFRFQWHFDQVETISGDHIAGNIIGLNAAGTQLVSNLGDGVQSDAINTTRSAWADAADRNVISGNDGSGINLGISILGTGSGDHIAGNIIGLNAAGTQLVPNSSAMGVQSDASRHDRSAGRTPPIAMSSPATPVSADQPRGLRKRLPGRGQFHRHRSDRDEEGRG